MEIRAAKTILLIIAAFVICNTPVFAVTWYDHGNEQQGPNDNDSVPSNDRSKRLFLLSVAMWQVCIDPMIYIVRLKDFKRIRQSCFDFMLFALRKIFRSWNYWIKWTVQKLKGLKHPTSVIRDFYPGFHHELKELPGPSYREIVSRNFSKWSGVPNSLSGTIFHWSQGKNGLLDDCARTFAQNLKEEDGPMV